MKNELPYYIYQRCVQMGSKGSCNQCGYRKECSSLNKIKEEAKNETTKANLR